MQSIYLVISAWREILAQTLDTFEAQDNVSPAWLVNPATKRRLKLDRFYPDAALAIRFVGLTAKGQKRQSDWEAMETEQRDQTRAELCRLNGVQLAIIDPIEEPLKQFDRFIQTLSAAARTAPTAPKSKRSAENGAAETAGRLQNAVRKASDLRSRMTKNPEQFMATLAECWRDRETGLLNELTASSPPTSTRTAKKKLVKRVAIGQTIEHERLGLGEIIEIDGQGEEERISILFQGGEQPRTFLMELVRDKLVVVKAAKAT